MKLTAASLALAATAAAAPSNERRQDSPGGCDAPVELDASTNIFSSYKLHANSFYRSEVEAAAAEMSGTLAEQALKVADIGTFVWW